VEKGWVSRDSEVCVKKEPSKMTLCEKSFEWGREGGSVAGLGCFETREKNGRRGKWGGCMYSLGGREGCKCGSTSSKAEENLESE